MHTLAGSSPDFVSKLLQHNPLNLDVIPPVFKTLEVLLSGVWCCQVVSKELRCVWDWKYLLWKVEGSDAQRPEAAEHWEKGQAQIVLRDHQRKVALAVCVAKVLDGWVLRVTQHAGRGWPLVSNCPMHNSSFFIKFSLVLLALLTIIRKHFSGLLFNLFAKSSIKHLFSLWDLITNSQMSTTTQVEKRRMRDSYINTQIQSTLWFTMMDLVKCFIRYVALISSTQLHNFAGACEIMWLNEVSLYCAGCAAGNSWLMHLFKTSAYSVRLPPQLSHCQISWWFI